MHELGIVFHIIKTVEEVSSENDVEGINSVVLEVGEVSGIVNSYLTDCWKWAVKKKDLLEEAELVIETIPAVTYCETCEKQYETVKYGKICPHCNSERTYLLRGNEVNIKEIECF